MTRIVDLPLTNSLANNDIVLVVTDPSGSQLTRVATVGQLLSGGNGGFTNGQSISVSNLVVTNTFSVNTINVSNSITTNTINANLINVSNLVITNALFANGSTGTAGQFLTSNGTSVYWSTTTTVGSVNTAFQYVWSNTQTFTNTITFSQTINGTINNAINFNGLSLSNVQSQITGNAATAYSNAVANAAALYQTTAGLAANVANFTANNSTNFGGLSLATIQNQITGNAATAYANAIIDITSYYQTTAGLADKVATLTANNTTYFGGLTLSTVQSQITSNAAAAYSNAIANAAALYQTTAGLAANVAGLTANNTTYFGGITLSTIQNQISANAASAYSNAVSDAAALYQTKANLATDVAGLTANNTTYFGGLTLSTVQSQITGNATSAYSNAVANAAALYQTTAGLASNVATLTSNNTTYFGDLTLSTVQSQITGNAISAYSNAIAFAANANNITNGTLPNARLSSAIVNTSGNFTITGNLNFTASNNYYNTIRVAGNTNINRLVANGSAGLNGQVLFSNGNGIYWGYTNNSGVFGGGGSGIANTPYLRLTSNTVLIPYGSFLLDTSNESIYVTLPGSPNEGDKVVIADGGGDKIINPAIVLRNGSTIADTSDDLLFDMIDTRIEFVYTGSTWKVFIA
jgi:hypothetical protein